MPSPVGHSLMGYIIYRATTRPVGKQTWPLIAFYLFAANAPDLDFIPGFLIGDPNRYHHAITHSIGFAVLFASVFSLFLLLLKRDSIGRHFAISLLVYLSHVGLDYLSIDTSAPYGVPLFWPFRDEYYIAPFAFLVDIKRASSSNIGFIASLFSWHNVWAATFECILLFPFILLMLSLSRTARWSAGRTSHLFAQSEAKKRSKI